MAGFSASGATVTFSSSGGTVTVVATSLKVDSPKAILTNMTSATAGAGSAVMAPTGEFSPGSMTVDFIASSGFSNPQALSGAYGSLSLSSPSYSVSRQAVLESSSVTAQSGDAVRGTLGFVITDFYG
jgi:hypothetical protein